MRPNQQEQQKLQQYLGSKLKYRETYAEFYDHIISSLENKSANIPFEVAIQNIIQDDFGGVEEMQRIENSYQRSIFTEMKKKYISYTLENLKFPQIIILSAFVIIAYYLVKQPWVDFTEFVLLLFVIRIIPSILLIIIRFKSNLIGSAPKRSIRSNFLKWQNRPQALILICWVLWDSVIFNNPILKPVDMVILLTLITIHSFTFYKVCRDDLKMSLKAC